jgi:hypothetical protein
MIEYAIFIILIVGISLYLIWDYLRKDKRPSQQSSIVSKSKSEDYDSFLKEYSEKKVTTPSEKTVTDFDTIVQVLKESFHPKSKNEEVCENQLMEFLNLRFPRKIVRKGHTSRGVKIDLVIEGSYAFELVVLNSEGKLLSLMNQMTKSTSDFGKIAVILVDIGKVSSYRIKDYVSELEQIGGKVILKKVS